MTPRLESGSVGSQSRRRADPGSCRCVRPRAGRFSGGTARDEEEPELDANEQSASALARAAALALVAALVAGPLSTHLYWLFGGTWGLYRNGVQEDVATTGVRVLAAVVVVLLIGALLVVLARVGWWRQRFVSDRVIRFLAWVLAAVFLLETLANFTWSRGEPDWLLYALGSLVIAVLALIVAASGGTSPPQRIGQEAL